MSTSQWRMGLPVPRGGCQQEGLPILKALPQLCTTAPRRLPRVQPGPLTVGRLSQLGGSSVQQGEALSFPPPRVPGPDRVGRGAEGHLLKTQRSLCSLDRAGAPGPLD